MLFRSGTGPFKFVEFKANDSIKLAKNTDYWKPGLPYLDGIEFTIIPNRSTAILAFVAGKYELTFAGTLTIALTRDLQSQRRDAICELPPGSVSTNLIVNRTALKTQPERIGGWIARFRDALTR